MECNVKSAFLSDIAQKYFLELCDKISGKIAMSVYGRISPGTLSLDSSVANQISTTLNSPLNTVVQAIENDYQVAVIERPSLIFSTEGLELFSRFVQTLDLEHGLPWLPIHAVGPGVVLVNCLPNIPLPEGIPSELVSKVVLPPKDYIQFAEDIVNASIDLNGCRRSLGISGTIPENDVRDIDNFLKLTPTRFAQVLRLLYVSASNDYKELEKLEHDLPDTPQSDEEFLSLLENNFPKLIGEWFYWRHKLKTGKACLFSSFLSVDYHGFFRPLSLIDPNVNAYDGVAHNVLTKIWSAGCGILGLRDKTLFLVQAVHNDDQATAFADMKRACSQFQLHFSVCAESDLNEYVSAQNEAYNTLRAKTSLLSTNPLNARESLSNIVSINNGELTDNDITAFVTRILSMAINIGASDIHIEPVADSCVIRFRVDGVLRKQIDAISDSYLPLIINKVKTLATNMDITTNNRPQDGRARLRNEATNSIIDLRIATIPIEADNYGREKCVIRILDNSKSPDKIDSIFWDPWQRAEIRNAIESPYGCIIVTGPTGSGKSTTLYTLLNTVNSSEKNIMTIEDPVERKLLGVQQVSVTPEVSFSGALRAFLRMDPDVILIGEVRDDETAKLTVRAAQTGHLCLTTLHTNNALGAIERLSHLGVKGHDIASSLLMVTGQRLLRTLCPSCRRKVKLSITQKEDFKRYNITSELIEEGYVYAPPLRGCRSCHNTGYSQRIAITEVIPIDEELREMILHEVSHKDLADKVKEKGFHHMYYYGLTAIARGLTDFKELHKLSEGF